MLETEKQRRWWFATHPEYSSSGTGAKRQAEDEGNHGGEKVPPEEVDEYVDYALQHVDGPLAVFLESIMRNFGTEALAADKPTKNEAPLPIRANFGKNSSVNRANLVAVIVVFSVFLAEFDKGIAIF